MDYMLQRCVVSRNGRLVIVSAYSKLLSLHVQNYGMDVTIWWHSRRHFSLPVSGKE